MTTKRRFSCRLLATTSLLIALSACSALRPGPASSPAFYTLEGRQDAATAAATEAAPATAPTLMIDPPHAAAGYDSSRIIYTREPHKLEYFAHSEWIDPPPRMLAPLLVAALANSGAFRAVVLMPSAANGDLRLATEIIRLQHEFGTQPSRVRFTLRAYLVDNRTRRVLASQEFDASAPAASEDPHAGVVAANLAVQSAIGKLASFCAEAARNTRIGE